MGCGAGILNGETTRVGMSVIPRERSGMASGVQGTVRFTGLVVGIAALGVVLYGRIASNIAHALPEADASVTTSFVQAITAGHISAAALPHSDPVAMKILATTSFAMGYQWLFLAGALFTAISTVLTWRLVSAEETPPVPAPVRSIATAKESADFSGYLYSENLSEESVAD